MKRLSTIVVIVVGVLLLGFAAGRFSNRHTGNSSSPSRRVLYYVDPMHPAYRSDKPGIAPDCGMALEPVYEGESTSPAGSLKAGAVVLSPDQQRLIGIRGAIVSKGTGARKIRTTGRVIPDDNHLYRIIAGVDGWVESFDNNPPGILVKKDQVLATLYSPDIRAAQQNYIGFVAGVERLRQASQPGDLKTIEASASINEEQLRLLGMGDKQIKQIAAKHQAGSTLDLTAPGDGIVLARNVSAHQRFERGTELYRIADLQHVWITADVHDQDGQLPPGTRAKVTVPELRRTIEATVSSATPLFDEASRTLKLRLEADNPGLLLRPDMFVDVEFEAKTPSGLLLPAEAVLDSGLRKIVYVETSDGVFEPREVEIAGTFGDQVAIAKGITDGDRVVVSGNFLLDSESRMRSPSLSTQASKPAMSPSTMPMNRGAKQMKANQTGQAGKMRDPVCGMTLEAGDVAFKETYKGKMYGFCSDSCHQKFLADPEKYTGEKGSHAMIVQDLAANNHD
ncbi:MAG: efflux RND transporter periplasmic adaptor subunit [Candidatus Solibacter sp.]|nr:efflux RND transporter periplasmic adaptor subunit [Candidatus Solibacter sp.]